MSAHRQRMRIDVHHDGDGMRYAHARQVQPQPVHAWPRRGENVLLQSRASAAPAVRHSVRGRGAVGIPPAMLARAAREASRRAAAPLRRYAAAPALVSDVTVPFTVVDYDGVRHKCVGRVGHNLVKSMQQQGLPMVLMGVQGYDAAVRVSREFQGKVPEMDLAHVRAHAARAEHACARTRDWAIGRLGVPNPKARPSVARSVHAPPFGSAVPPPMRLRTRAHSSGGVPFLHPPHLSRALFTPDPRARDSFFECAILRWESRKS